MTEKPVTRRTLHRLIRATAFAGFASIVLAAGVHAQPRCELLRPEAPSDYYSARGCGLLQSVEQYHLGPGRDKLKSGHFSGAAGDFQFMLRIFPNHPLALLGLTETCDRWRSPDRVAFCSLDEWFVRATEINPSATGTFLAKGVYEHRRGRFPDSVASFQRAVELEPENANAHYNLALSYLEVKQFARANEHAQRAYALGSTLPGLRDRLQRARQWKPEAAAPAKAGN